MPDGTTTSTRGYTYDLDGRLLTVLDNGATIAVNTYQGAQLASVAYPAGPGNAGNGTALSQIRTNLAGATTGMTWDFGDQAPITEDVVRSQTGRILTNTLVDGTTTSKSAYSYDAAGRLIAATIPRHKLTYQYAATGGCGVNTMAGLSGNRTGYTDSLDGATPTTITSCYDHADRLTGTRVTNRQLDANPINGANLSTTTEHPPRPTKPRSTRACLPCRCPTTHTATPSASPTRSSATTPPTDTPAQLFPTARKSPTHGTPPIASCNAQPRTAQGSRPRSSSDSPARAHHRSYSTKHGCLRPIKWRFPAERPHSPQQAEPGHGPIRICMVISSPPRTKRASDRGAQILTIRSVNRWTQHLELLVAQARMTR